MRDPTLIEGKNRYEFSESAEIPKSSTLYDTAKTPKIERLQNRKMKEAPRLSAAWEAARGLMKAAVGLCTIEAYIIFQQYSLSSILSVYYEGAPKPYS